MSVKAPLTWVVRIKLAEYMLEIPFWMPLASATK